MSKQNNGCTSFSYQYQHSYLLQHCHERKENTAIPQQMSDPANEFFGKRRIFSLFFGLG